MEGEHRFVRTPGAAPGTLSVALLSVTLWAALASAARSAVPEPADGRWATTAVALLRHSHQRCAGAADRLLDHWRQLGGDGEGVQEALDRFVLTEATEDLAAARKALDLARGLLPRAALEVDTASAAVLDRLYAAETALCNLAALPAPPRGDFQRRLEEAAAAIGDAETELGGHLTLPDEGALSLQIQPYLSLIAAAASSAQQQMLDDRLPPPPPPELTLQERMEAWHRRYAAAALPSKQALRAYLEGRRAADAAAIQRACAGLMTAVLPLLADEAVFRAPDPEVREPLQDIYRAMRRLGVHCTAGRFREVDVEYGHVQRHLSAAAGVLSAYSLGP